jgi:outer membrane lipopolysaccharide assembly protein LptE/RlpB
MRTTIDLPADLHKQALAIARDTARSLSETVADLMRRGLEHGEGTGISQSAQTGLPVLHLGKVITSEDVRSLEDETT